MNLKLLSKFSWALLLLLLVCTGLYAQERKITGKVVDQQDGQPIPGANVSIKGKPSNVSTNADGVYAIQVASDDDVLVFSYIGYTRQTISVGKQRSINVSLASDKKDLDEVVVVGYGTQKKANLTGAVAVVDMKAIEDIPAGSLSAALKGQLPGVSVSGGFNRPGDNAQITIRNPILYSKDGGNLRPLYVIDDVVRSEDDFNILDASEVESISVLKDAAAAVYGLKGNQGVILVKTKRGKNGPPKISYSGSVGTADATMLPKMMNGYQQAIYLNDLKIADNKPNDAGIYTPDELSYFKDHNYDWLGMAWQTALVTRQTVNVSGGSEKATYFAGATYNYQNANFDNIDANRWTFRASTDLKLTTGLSLGLSVSGDLGNKRMYYLKQGGENPEKDMQTLLYTPQFNPPYINGMPVLLTSGTSSTTDNFHFFEVQKSDNYTATRSTGLNVNANLNYQIPFINGLSAKFVYNRTMDNTFGKQYGTKYNVYGFSMLGTNKHIYGGDVTSIISLNNGDRVRINPDYTDNYQVNGSLNYDRKFGKHQISALALFEQRESHYDNVQAMVEGVIVGGLDNMKYGTGTQTTSESESEFGYLSYVGRLNYSYADKYLLEFTLRADASTNFAPENRWGYFPSVSAGWIISEEGFFKKNVPFVNFLKIRGSVGLMGADRTKAYNWLTSYNIQTGKAAVFGGNGDRGLVITPNNAMANRNIKWDDDTKVNGGIDARFLKDRLSFTADGFYDHNYNMLTSLTSSVSLLVGATLPSENFATVNGFGYELSLGWKDRIGSDWGYNVNTFLSWSDNKIIKYDIDKGKIGTWEDRTGKSSDGGLTGYKYQGMFRSQSEVDAYLSEHPGYTLFGTAPKPGLLYYQDIRGPKDANGNFTAPDGIITDIDQDYISKKSSNHYGLGFNWGVSYKSLSLGVVMGVSFGGQGSVESTARSQATVSSNRPDFWSDHWTPDNPNAAFPSPLYKDTYNVMSEFWFKSSTSFRVSNLNLSYSVPSKWVNRIGVGSARAFLTSTNPINFYNPYTYRDNAGSYDAYPLMRSFSLGLNIGL